MATQLVSALSIDAAADAKMWKGGSRLVYGSVAPESPVPTNPVPRFIEDVINLATYALLAGWNDFGATSEDGITVTRSWDTQDPINIDQRDYGLRGGNPTNFQMTLTGTTVDTSPDRLAQLWALGEIATIAAAPGGTPPNVAQRSVEMGAPNIITERPMVVLQQNDATGKVRMFFFRKAVIQSGGDIQVQSRGIATQQFTFQVRPDTAITDGSDFGLLFQIT